MAGALWGSRLVLAAVFATAGVAKLSDLEQSRRSVADFGVPGRGAALIGTLLPLAELAVAMGLVVEGTARVAAIGALALLFAFAIVIAANLARGRTPDCRCFGQVHSAPVSWRSQARNLVLVALALALVAGGAGTEPAAAASWAGGFAVIALSLGLVLRARRRTTPPRISDEAGGPAVGAPAPGFSLASLDGRGVSLASLLSLRRPVLLVFSDRGCGPCQALAPTLAGWQRHHAAEVTVAVVERGHGDARGPDEHGRANVLVDDGDRVASAYRVAGTPTAVLIDADGRIASGLAPGAAAIEARLARIVPGLRRSKPAIELPAGRRSGLARRELFARAATAWVALTTAGLTFLPSGDASAFTDLKRGCRHPRVRCRGKCCPPGFVCRRGRCRCPHRTRVRCGKRCCPPRFVCKRERRRGRMRHRCHCPRGVRRCGRDCAALDRDPTNCGGCGRRCGPGQVCVAGRCQADATGPGGGGGGGGSNGCPDDCAPGTACSGGTRVEACPEGTTQCGCQCTDLEQDPRNCGRCGRPCPPGQVCVGGECTTECPQALTKCGDNCAELKRDIKNCGRCRHHCRFANGGAIPLCCGGTCVDGSVHPGNCGRCGHSCGPDCYCQHGLCAPGREGVVCP